MVGAPLHHFPSLRGKSCPPQAPTVHPGLVLAPRGCSLPLGGLRRARWSASLQPGLWPVPSLCHAGSRPFPVPWAARAGPWGIPLPPCCGLSPTSSPALPS